MTPETRLSGFVAYATSRPDARAKAVRQAAGGDYKIEQDFYLRMRQAVKADRKGARDGSRIAAAAANATPKKADRFAALVANWPKVVSRWNATRPVEVERASVAIAGLTVNVTPTFAELDSFGDLEIVLVDFADRGLSPNDIDMILRLVQRAYTPLYPTGCVTFVDLGTARVRTTANRDLRRHDMRIETDAAGLAYGLRVAA